MARTVQYIEPTQSSVDSLLGDVRWHTDVDTTMVLTYSFAQSVDDYFVDDLFGYDAGERDWDLPFRKGFASFSAEEQSLVRSIFNDYENIINVEFVEVDTPDTATMRIAFTDLDREDSDGLAFAPTIRYLPFGVDASEVHEASELSGDIWIENSLGDDGQTDLFAQTLIHEIGHALGLSHPHENGFSDVKNANTSALDVELDYSRYTVMSYEVAPASVSDYELIYWSVTSTPMPLDVEALQHLYGSSQLERDDVYVINPFSDVRLEITDLRHDDATIHQYTNSYISITDTGGINSLYIPFDNDLVLDINAGTWLNTAGGILTTEFDDDNIYIAQGTNIHELTSGNGNDHITGNSLNNVINASGGADVVIGGLGDDTVYLGDGWDQYSYVGGNDHIDGGFGSDSIHFGDLAHSQFKFISDENGSVTLASISSDTEIQLDSVELLVFGDTRLGANQIQKDIAEVGRALLIDEDIPLYLSDVIGAENTVSATEAQLYRIYFGSLGRAPDREGFDFWLDQLQQGIYGFSEVASRFVDSSEFISLADNDIDGAVSSAEFLDHMYQNVFGRAPDQGGYNWWLGQLDDGSHSQPSAFESMVQSDEFVLISAATVSDFLFV